MRWVGKKNSRVVFRSNPHSKPPADIAKQRGYTNSGCTPTLARSGAKQLHSTSTSDTYGERYKNTHNNFDWRYKRIITIRQGSAVKDLPTSTCERIQEKMNSQVGMKACSLKERSEEKCAKKSEEK